MFEFLEPILGIFATIDVTSINRMVEQGLLLASSQAAPTTRASRPLEAAPDSIRVG